MTYPLLQSALAGLDLDLEAELKRYKYHHEDTLPIDLEVVNQDSDPFFNPNFSSALDSDFELDLEDKDLDLNSDPSLPIFELSYLDDLSGDLENNLEEEFRDRIQPRESGKFSEDFTGDFGENFTEKFAEDLTETSPNQNSKEATPNLLGPLGIIAMILLLVSSAAVGYLLVDPSGLNRLIEREDPNLNKPTSLLPVNLIERLELFQTKTFSKVEPVPFVDFSISKNSDKSPNKSQVLTLPTLIPPIGIGRSFEPPVPPVSPIVSPITVEPENRIKLPPVPDRIVINPQKPSKPQSQKFPQVDKNSSLQPERTLPNPEIILQSKPVRLPSEEQITTPKLLSAPSVSENKPLVEINPKPNSETEVKIETKQEVVQELN